jgi:hypothetical protein
MKWFRFYNEVLDDPKVQTLSPELFKFWVNILCIASKNDGKLPSIEAISYHVRASVSATQCLVDALLEAQLLQEFTNQHSKWLAPHSWHKRQYKSDVSTDRVKRFRNAKRNKVVTPPDTDTDTDTEQSKKVIKKQTKPDVVSNETWDNFKKLRAAKKSPITDLVITRILGEADNAGISLEEALQECCERGWTSFKADWYNNSRGNNYGKRNNNKSSVHDDFTKGIALGLAELDKQSRY